MMKTLSIIVVGLQLTACSLVVDSKLDDKSTANTTNNTTNNTNHADPDLGSPEGPPPMRVECETMVPFPGGLERGDQAFDLAVDEQGWPHIVMINEGRLQYYAWTTRNDERVWEETEIPLSPDGPLSPADTPKKVAIAVVSERSQVHVIYSTPSGMMHVVREEGRWRSPTPLTIGDLVFGTPWDSFDMAAFGEAVLVAVAIEGLWVGNLSGGNGHYTTKACNFLARHGKDLSNLRLSTGLGTQAQPRIVLSVHDPTLPGWRIERFRIKAGSCPSVKQTEDIVSEAKPGVAAVDIDEGVARVFVAFDPDVFEVTWTEEFSSPMQLDPPVQADRASLSFSSQGMAALSYVDKGQLWLAISRGDSDLPWNVAAIEEQAGERTRIEIGNEQAHILYDVRGPQSTTNAAYFCRQF